ncbi:hypothetical protein [Novosphingobium sp.]|uniref:hypothetical protein n=1 Tax=Novosphingobium sp. TaxID=1874826 RepID=UPI003D0A23AD
MSSPLTLSSPVTAAQSLASSAQTTTAAHETRLISLYVAAHEKDPDFLRSLQLELIRCSYATEISLPRTSVTFDVVRSLAIYCPYLRSFSCKDWSYHGAFFQGAFCDKHATLKVFDTFEYVGGFAAGRKHGAGKIVFADGSYVQGHWSNDRLHGHCRVDMPRGVTLTGTYYEDVCEKATIRYSSGVRFEGRTHVSTPAGLGKVIYQDGSTYAGHFVDGVSSAGILTRGGNTSRGHVCRHLMFHRRPWLRLGNRQT